MNDIIHNLNLYTDERHAHVRHDIYRVIEEDDHRLHAVDQEDEAHCLNIPRHHIGSPYYRPDNAAWRILWRDGDMTVEHAKSLLFEQALADLDDEGVRRAQREARVKRLFHQHLIRHV